MELIERIENKQKQIAKMEKNLVKYAKEVDEEFIKMCDRYFETKDYSELKQYKISHNMMFLPEYYSKRYDLEDAKATLEKYQKQLIKENDKNSTLNELPESIKEFREKLIERWNSYDFWKRDEIKKIYNDDSISYKERTEKLTKMFGRGWYEFKYLTNNQIEEQNKKDADKLILNMINRVVEITGKITDTKYLSTHSDNQGYTIINGKIIGEKGTAIIESIGAGGYNIQRYHIRVLVKEVK